MSDWRFIFSYGSNGRGILQLRQIEGAIFSFEARTGSIDSNGRLVNVIAPGRAWSVKDLPVETNESGMRTNGIIGYKVRLYDECKYTNYLIHYDEKLNGTRGCIGLQKVEDTLQVMTMIRAILIEDNKPIPILIERIK